MTDEETVREYIARRDREGWRYPYFAAAEAMFTLLIVGGLVLAALTWLGSEGYGVEVWQAFVLGPLLLVAAYAMGFSAGKVR